MPNSSQRIMWTVLPRGKQNGIVQLSVLVSPRLVNPDGVQSQSLSLFPDFVDWIATLSHIGFSIVFEKGPTIKVGPPTSYEDYKKLQKRGLPRCVVPRAFSRKVNPWKLLFGTVTGSPVNPVVRSRGGSKGYSKAIATYSSRELSKALLSQYTALISDTEPFSNDPEGLKVQTAISNFPFFTNQGAQAQPDVNSLIAERLKGIRDRQNATVSKLVAAAHIPGRASPPNFSLAEEDRISSIFLPPNNITMSVGDWNLALFRFYREVLQSPSKEVSPISREELEFHKQLASVSQFPFILRQVGLVLDFELPISSGLASSGAVRVIPDWDTPQSNVKTTNISPATVFESTAQNFIASPKPGGSDLFNGFVDLSTTVNGVPRYSVEQIDAFAEAAHLYSYVTSVKNEVNSKLPSPVSGHIALVRDAGANVVQEKILKSIFYESLAESSEDQNIFFFADDLIRGVRMDVKVGDRWFSLNERVGLYNFTIDGYEAGAEDEGWVSVTTPQTSAAGIEFIATHDIVARWDGWSQAVPRPIKGIVSQSSEATGNSPSTLQTIFAPRPKSLPRLRFGQTYKVRVRTVDLAGNGPMENLGFDEERLSKSITFFRFLPVPPPDVIPREIPDEAHGESEHVLVIRSNFDSACEEFQERHIAPPRTSELTAEMHGKFDTAGSGRLDPDAFKLISKFDEEAPNVFPDDEYSPTYLTDPLAVGVHFQNLPGSSDKYTALDFGRSDKKWPRTKSWRLRVVAPNESNTATENPPQFLPPTIDEDKESGVLTVYLPKAAVAKINLSSAINREDLELLGFWDLIRTSFASNSDLFKTHILNGGHWMFNPSVELSFVHAVQQPLFPPRFDGDSPIGSAPPLSYSRKPITVERQRDETFARLTTRIFMPGRSSNKFDVVGTWKEIATSPQENCKTETIDGHAFTGTLQQVDSLVDVVGNHQFGDTKHRVITYKVVASTRFREYLRITDEEIAAGRPISQSSREVIVNIPSSAKPAAPDVSNVLPAFGWSPNPSTALPAPNTRMIVRKRHGGGVRVFLNGGWYLTGENELLGVVLGDSDSGPEPCFSQWGRDPLSTSPGPRLLSIDDFNSGYFQHHEKVFSSDCGKEVTVVGFPVKCDPARQLWYSDIVLNTGNAYFPFLRLVVSRYQPDSLEDLKISDSKVVDFVQIAPDRTASLVIESSKPNQVVRIRLDGNALVRGNRVEVSIDRANEDAASSAVKDELVWESVTSEPKQMIFKSEANVDFWELDNIFVPIEKFRHRVTIREVEELESDSGKIDRIVYVGTIEL